MNLIPEIETKAPELKAWRQHIHQRPELSFDEAQTAAFVAQKLRDFGFKHIQENYGGHSLVTSLTRGVGPCIALRADMDALPIDEQTGAAYCSQHDGVMHACGHDGHTVMLLGAAQYLATQHDFSGQIVFLFQAAEERGAGAKAMIEAGLFDDYPIEQIYGLHNLPGLSPGQLVFSPGPVMGSVNEFNITVRGKGGHAAMPFQAHNPIIAASQITLALQTLSSELINPASPIVITTTALNAGSAFNVIPASANIKGTVRYLNPEVGDWIEARLVDVVTHCAKAQHNNAELSYATHTLPTVNDENAALLARSVAVEQLGCAALEQPRILPGEDFCYFAKARPSAFGFIGNGKSAGLHHPEYDFNDDNLVVGASFFSALAKRALPASMA